MVILVKVTVVFMMMVVITNATSIKIFSFHRVFPAVLWAVFSTNVRVMQMQQQQQQHDQAAKIRHISHVCAL